VEISQRLSVGKNGAWEIRSRPHRVGHLLMAAVEDLFFVFVDPVV